MIRRSMAVVVLAVLLFSAASAQEKPPVSPAPKPSASGSDLVVMRINGEPVTERQVVTAIGSVSRQAIPLGDTQQQRNINLYKGAIDKVTFDVLLRNEARRQNLLPDKAKVEQEVQKIAKSFPSPEEFKKALTGQGLSEIALRNGIELAMSVQLMLDQITRDVPGATDAAVQKFYDDNPKRFLTQEQVHAAHILLIADKNSTPEKREELKKKLNGIKSDIESKKISFTDAAVQFSQDTGNASKGGDLGFFSRGVMTKPFEDAAFGMEPGALSPIIETEFGYHIIYLIAKKPAGKKTLEEAKPEIKRQLDQASRSKVAQQYANELKAKATIETFMTPEEFIKRHASGR